MKAASHAALAARGVIPHVAAIIVSAKRAGANSRSGTRRDVAARVSAVRRHRPGKTGRAAELENLVTAILADFNDRVLPVDTDTARHIARLGELVHRQPIGLPDLIIAATAVRHGLVLLTRNMSELGRLGIAARDPFIDLPPDV